MFQIFSTILSLSGAYFAAKERIIKWPIGILANTIAIFIYWNSGLYIKAVFSLVFIVDSFYGLYQWLYGGPRKTKLHVTTTKKTTLLYIVLYGFFLVYILSSFIYKFTHNKISIYESFAIFTIIAHWMMARKKLENWILWIILDILFINICLYKGLYVFALKYLIYTFLALYGFMSWKRTIK